MKAKIAMLVALFSVNVAALAAGTSNAVLKDYLKIQALLAHDTFAGVTAEAKQLSLDAKKMKDVKLSASAAELAQATDLNSARLQFEKISALAVPGFKKHLDPKVESVYCPMKKQRWVQNKGPIENPFYGKEMLECGVKDR